MDSKLKQPKTLQEAIWYFGNPDNALAYMVRLKWPDGIVTCPVCGRTDVVFLKTQRKWQCKSVHPKRQFSAKVGTIFEDSPIPLEKWMVAVWMICNCNNRISSYELAKTVGVTQKSAWFMLHRIRLALSSISVARPNNFGRERRIMGVHKVGHMATVATNSLQQQRISGSRVFDESEAHALFEETAQLYMHMSGEEFLRRWDSNDFVDVGEPSNIMRVAALIPLVRKLDARKKSR